MKLLISIQFVFMITLLMSSCSQDEQLMYQDDPSVYFYKRGGGLDSVDYSFALETTDVTTDTIGLTFRIMGLARDYDRPISLMLEEGSNAKEGYHYKVENLFIPAGEYEVDASLIFFRRAGLKDSTIVGILKVVDNSELKAGYNDVVVGAAFDRLSYRFTLTDKLSKPSIWDARWLPLFGEYSNTKLLFLTGATGYKTWNAFVSLPQDQNQMVQNARYALYEHERDQGPLLDENGNRVVLP